MFLCPIWKVLHVNTHKTSFSLKRTYVWHITPKQFSAISANRGYRGWSLIRVNYQHSSDSNLILSPKLLLPDDHHQIWLMGLRFYSEFTDVSHAKAGCAETEAAHVERTHFIDSRLFISQEIITAEMSTPTPTAVRNFHERD